MKLIYLFGQPGSGKTTLASRIKVVLGTQKPTFLIDGDRIRELTNNKDYTITGRIENIEFAHRLALLALSQNMNVVLALVSPYEELRANFKIECIGKEHKPTFVFLDYDSELDKRGKEQNWVPEIEVGPSCDIKINTSFKTIGGCLDTILS